jgi:curved DNA-binding protein CbpA
MSNNIDYYQVLGVIPSAEPSVIKAAYRALASIYHPDKNTDADATEKIKDINSAYSVLSDPIKKREYDKSRESSQHNANASEFEEKTPFTNETLEKDWKIATEFYPRINREFIKLAKISWRLAFAFKLQILDSQKYSDSRQLSDKLRTEYLSKYFGNDVEIIYYAEQLIKCKRIDAALYLNSVITVMGKSVSIYDVRDKINKKFPNLNVELEARLHYEAIRDQYGEFDYSAAMQLVQQHGGETKTKFFGAQITLNLNGSTHVFKDRVDFCKFILQEYAMKYA